MSADPGNPNDAGGITALVIGSVQTFLACTYHAPAAVAAPSVRRTSDAGVPIGVS